MAVHLVLGGVGAGLEGDVVSEGLELFDGSGFGFCGAVSGVVVGAGVLVEGVVDKQVPGAGEHLVFQGDYGGLSGGGLAARFFGGGLGWPAPGDASEADAEVGVGAARR